MPERRSILPHSIDRVDVVLVEGTSVVGGINLTVCDVHSQIVKVPADGNSSLVEPFAGAVSKVEDSVDGDHVGSMRPCVLSGTVAWEEESFKIVVSTDLNSDQTDSYQ